MYYKELVKNRNRLLTNDLIIKFPLISPDKKQFKHIKSIEIISNLDNKPYKELDKTRSKLRIFTTYFMLSRIFTQLPTFIKAKKSVANFNVREGMEVGVKLNLRDKNMERWLKKWLVLLSSNSIISSSPLKENKYKFDKTFDIQKDSSLSNIFAIQPYNGFLWNFKNIIENTQKDYKIDNKMESNINDNNLSNLYKLKFYNNNTLSIISNFYPNFSSNYQFNKDLLINSNNRESLTFHLKTIPLNTGLHIRVKFNHIYNKQYNKDYKNFILSYYLIPSF